MVMLCAWRCVYGDVICMAMSHVWRCHMYGDVACMAMLYGDVVCMVSVCVW